MKKVLLWVAGILAALCIAVALIWGSEIASLRSVKSVDGNGDPVRHRIPVPVIENRMVIERLA